MRSQDKTRFTWLSKEMGDDCLSILDYELEPYNGVGACSGSTRRREPSAHEPTQDR